MMKIELQTSREYTRRYNFALESRSTTDGANGQLQTLRPALRLPICTCLLSEQPSPAVRFSLRAKHAVCARAEYSNRIRLLRACHSLLTSCFKYLQSMRKVHESLTSLLPPRRPAVLFYVSFILFRSSIRPSRSLSPSALFLSLLSHFPFVS